MQPLFSLRNVAGYGSSPDKSLLFKRTLRLSSLGCLGLLEVLGPGGSPIDGASYETQETRLPWNAGSPVGRKLSRGLQDRPRGVLQVSTSGGCLGVFKHGCEVFLVGL